MKPVNRQLNEMLERLDKIENIICTATCEGCGFSFDDIESITVDDSDPYYPKLRCWSCVKTSGDAKNDTD